MPSTAMLTLSVEEESGALGFLAARMRTDLALRVHFATLSKVPYADIRAKPFNLTDLLV